MTTAHAVKPPTPALQNRAPSFAPKPSEGMAGYLERISRLSGAIFVCSPTCLTYSPQEMLPQTLSATTIAERLARISRGGLVKKGKALIILPPLTGRKKRDAEDEVELWHNRIALLKFIDTFNEKQITEMTMENSYGLSLDDIPPAQASLFWKLNKEQGYVPGTEPIKDMHISFCRTKSIAIEAAGKGSLGWLGAFSYTGSGLSVNDTSMKTVKPIKIPRTVQPELLKNTAELHEVLLREYSSAGTLTTATPFVENLRLLKAKTDVDVVLNADITVQPPYVSVPSLRADNWYDLVTTYTGVQERKTGTRYILSLPPRTRGFMERSASLQLMQTFYPEQFAAYSRLIKSVTAKLTRLPEPKEGIPFAASDFRGPFQDRVNVKFTDLNDAQKGWVRLFVRKHPDRMDEHEKLSLDEAELYLRDLLWMQGFAGGMSFGIPLD